MGTVDRALGDLTALALSQGSSRPLPAPSWGPFRRYAAGSSTGELLVSRAVKGASAASILKRTLEDLRGIFDTLTVLDTAAASDEAEAQAFFRATLDGAPVLGIAVAALDQALAIYDRHESFLQMMQRLARRSTGVRRRETLPGGGSIRLPDGWQILSSRQGGVVAEGAEGRVDLGRWTLVYPPEQAAGMWVSPAVAAAFVTPERAFRDLLPEFRSARIVARTPIDWPMGHAELFELRRGNAAARILVMMSRNRDGTWLFYYSAAVAHREQDLPMPIEIWSSWRVGDSAYAQRILRAHQGADELALPCRADLLRRGILAMARPKN